MKYKNTLLVGVVLIIQMKSIMSTEHQQDSSIQGLRVGQHDLATRSYERSLDTKQHQTTQLQSAFAQERLRTQGLVEKIDDWNRDNDQVEFVGIHPGLKVDQKDTSSYEQTYKRNNYDRSKLSSESTSREEKRSSSEIKHKGNASIFGVGIGSDTSIRKTDTTIAESGKKSNQEAKSKTKIAGSISCNEKSTTSVELTKGEIQVKLTKRT